MKTQKNILLTGVAGFIGWKIAELLLSQGHNVVGFDSLNNYYDCRLKKYRLKLLEGREGFSFCRGNIEHRKSLEPLFAENQFDAVLNLAARAGVRYSMENPFVYLSTNAHGTLNLLELMRQYKVRKMVLASTSSLYAGHPLPFQEDQPVNHPISPYAASKKAAEVMAYSYHHLHRLDISVVRYFTVYGPAGRPDMSIFRFIKWIDEGHAIEVFGDGSQSRDFTYVDDIARGTILAARKTGYEIINLGGGQQPVSISEIITRLQELLGKKARVQHRPFHAADVAETRANIAKADKLLHWRPCIDVAEGLRRTVEWYLANRSWLRNVKI